MEKYLPQSQESPETLGKSIEPEGEDGKAVSTRIRDHVRI